MVNKNINMLILSFFFSLFIIGCNAWEFPPVKFQKYVLNCDEYKNCEKLLEQGQKIFEIEGCDLKTKPKFVRQMQRRGYCVDLKMHMDIAKQKMENYKK